MIKSIELFAGCGGLALGLEQAGLECVLLNEKDRDSCQSLRLNRPDWNIVEGDVANLDFSPWRGVVDFISGGFPCQSFSYAGKSLGLEDVRGTMFFELARAVTQAQPSVFVGENVKGLLSHDNGQTLKTIAKVIDEIGYDLLCVYLMNGIDYDVPQKRERLFLICVRKDLQGKLDFHLPLTGARVLTMRDALKAGSLYSCDVPDSPGQSYPQRKAEILALVPPGGCWRHLPTAVQLEYMQKSYYLGGGKTGIARRLAWDEPCLTLTCSPAQKMTERCHPNQTRPLTIREYARIQTFPDHWLFAGSISSQYKQIGNAVPVNMAEAIGRSVFRMCQQAQELEIGSQIS